MEAKPLFTKNITALKLAIRAVDHKMREEILRLLDENKGMTVTDLYIKLRIEQSVASQHLAILRRHDLVTTKRVGKNIYYNVNQRSIDELNAMADNWSMGAPTKSATKSAPLLYPAKKAMTSV